MTDDAVLALVESNTTGSGRQFCAIASGLGLRPVVLAVRPERYPYLDTDNVAHLVVDTADIGAVRDACVRLRDTDGLAGVASSSEYFVATAAEVATRLGLPAADAGALTCCRDKSTQRTVLAGAGVPVPGFVAVTDPGEAVAAAEALGYPVVVKPTTGSGSAGVRLGADAAAVAAHAGRLLDTAVDERGRPVPGRILVEEYIPGAEFSVETFDDTVVAVIAKRLGAEPHFVEVGHDFPAPVSGAVRAALGEHTRHALKALGLGWGAAHTELRLGPRGPVVIEVNPRLAGGMLPAVVAAGTGVDLVAAVVRRAAGRPVEIGPVAPHAHVAIRFAVAGSAGTVTAIGGLAAARAVPGVRSVAATVPVGSTVDITHSFRDRIGYAIAAATDPGAAATAAERAAALLDFEISGNRGAT